jgi:hypothetical protein
MESYESFIQALAKGNHPAYGHVIWDNQQKVMSFTVKFQYSQHDSADLVRQRCEVYLRRLSAEEWGLFHIEVTIRQGVPVYATITPREGAVGVIKLHTERLRQLAEA